ncbi:hypothetical protein [Gimesia maris]|uniref:Uncharacterized protein n=1 Tax=Gimesia maris TaxID=122 RepID=A0ABX5YGZ9_9PLAN|nr:hypothetical protein [Gimesia maris]QEG14854.1 hypothetical protein GmarT_06910 [Gimesia maris]QGQ31759.1 hypothetical protein F1729_25745 [Gimesia maris]
MKLFQRFPWKLLKHQGVITFLLFVLLIYTAASSTYLTYFVTGYVLRSPFESQGTYLIRSILFLSDEHKHSPEMYRAYVEELKTLEWDDVRGELMPRYLRSSPFIGSRSMFSVKQMIRLWPKELKAECEQIIAKQEQHRTLTEREYLNILYLHFDLCSSTYPGMREVASAKDASETCMKIREIVNKKPLTEESYSYGHDIYWMKTVVEHACPTEVESMGSAPASELISIYVIRLQNLESDTPKPPAQVTEQIMQLVDRLFELDGAEKITIENEAGVTRFVVAETGEVLAELDNSSQ